MNKTEDRQQTEAWLKKLDETAAKLDIHAAAQRLPGESTIAEKRRRRGRPSAADERIRTLTLVETDGVLRWTEGPVAAAGGGARRSRRGPAGAAGNVMTQLKFEQLEPNQVGAFLEKLDRDLTPNVGLRRWEKGKLKPVAKPQATKRALLLIHGTFSNTENLLGGINVTAQGRALLERAAQSYDEILTFDHPTLSVSPVLNALDLARLFADCPATIDVIAHSRGGLVTRWWLEGFARNGAQSKAVLVGSPLGGTSLAAPPRLRAGLDFITQIGRALEFAGGLAVPVAPFMTVAVGLLKVVTSITGLGAKLPLIDAAVAMVPGLAGQSRVSNNVELNRLHLAGGKPRPDYFAVTANFVPPSHPVWAFWRNFADWRERATKLGVDVVFNQENDLVVDARAMTELYVGQRAATGDAPAAAGVLLEPAKTLDFKTTGQVHHTNYFQQRETMEFIARSLGITLS